MDIVKGAKTKRDWLSYATVFALGLGTLVVAAEIRSFIGWMMLATIACAAFAWQRGDKSLFRIICLVLPIYAVCCRVAIYLSSINPRLLDPTFAALDHGIGIAVWHWAISHPLPSEILGVVYTSLGAAVIVSITFTECRYELLWALAVASIFGTVGYWIFPAVGPRHADNPLALRNCMPSLHLTYALLCWVYANPKLRAATLVFAILTAVATMSTGEHYFIDLVAAVGFTYAVCLTAKYRIQGLKTSEVK